MPNALQRHTLHQTSKQSYPQSFWLHFFFFLNLRPLYLGGSVSDYAGDLPRGTNIVAGGGKKKKLHGAFTQRGNRKWHAVMRDGLVVVRGVGGVALPSLSRREWMRKRRKQQIAAPVSAHASLSSCILAQKRRFFFFLFGVYGAPRQEGRKKKRAPPQLTGTR